MKKEISKVSVVTVCYNSEKTIEDTILSVVNQDYPNIEYVIIDGGSIDGTINVIKKYESKITQWISEKDSGIFNAMNKGIMMSTGDWIIFMNSGDAFTNSDTLSKLEYLLLNNDIGLIFSSCVLKYGKVRRLIEPRPFFTQNGKYRTMGFSHQSCLIRTRYIKKKGFDEKYNLCADYKMIWDLYYIERIKFIESKYPISEMDEGDGETVRSYFNHLEEECEVCGFPKSILRDFFVNTKYIEYRFKRIMKHILFQ